MTNPHQRDTLVHLITRAPALIRELDTTITKLDQQGATGSAGGDPLVFNVHASECKDDLTRALNAAAKAALGPDRHATIPIGRRHRPEDVAARIALENLDHLLKLADRVDAIEDRLDAAIHKATRAIDRAEERITYGPCACGVELSAPASRDTATCAACGRRWAVAELRAFRHVAARDRAHDAVGTIGQLVDVANGLGIKATRHSINGLIRRRGLAPVGQRAGVNLYRYGSLEPYL